MMGPVDVTRATPPPGAGSPCPGPDRPRPGRRAVLAAGAGAALLAAAGCNPFSTTKVTRTEVVEAPPPIDPIEQLIAKTRFHYLRLVAAVQLGGDVATKLTPLRDDRRAHLQALLDEQARTARTTAAPLTTAGQQVARPASAAVALEQTAQDAADAQAAFTDGLGAVSRYRATLFATIAASLAGHQEALR